jgi:hypothetical protein
LTHIGSFILNLMPGVLLHVLTARRVQIFSYLLPVS